MKLSDWFAQRNSDGSRRRKYAFAARIGRSASMVTDYCEGRAWPDRETMERIVTETAGEVTPNDFLQGEAAECVR